MKIRGEESASRRTRSQVAPEWTEADLLILVNEITAVEADCHKDFSSFQKWKTIAQNCTVLGVPRSLDQYRRKWEDLFHHYKIVKDWESQYDGESSYWVLDIDSKKQFGLPRSFDKEVFKAITGFENVQGIQSDTEISSDAEEAEAEDDVANEDDEVVVPESKRRRGRPTQQKSCTIQNSLRSCLVKKPVQKPRQMHVEEKTVVKPLPHHVEENTLQEPSQTHAQEKPRQTHTEGKSVKKPCQTKEKPVGKPCQTYVEEKPVEKSTPAHAEEIPVEKPCQTNEKENPMERCLELIPMKSLAEEQPAGSCLETIPMKSVAEKKLQKSRVKRKQQDTLSEEMAASLEEHEQIMAMKLQWSAELIRAIVTENADAANKKSTKDANLVRRQGDQVIACLADIVKTLNQVHDLVQERK